MENNPSAVLDSMPVVGEKENDGYSPNGPSEPV